MIVLDGRGTCTLVAPAAQCPSLYDTMALGLGLTIGGAVVGGAGGVLVYLGRPVERPVAFAPFVTPHAAGLAVGGRF